MASVPMMKMLPGVVKAVPSGDTIVLVKPGGASTGPPPELRLTLASLRAPALRPLGPTVVDPKPDDPYAFAAREFLRRATIGRTVFFMAEYRVEAMGNRLFGSVHLDAPDAPPLARTVVEAGMARVRRPATDREAKAVDFDRLCEIENEAEEARRGVFAGDAGRREEIHRVIEDVPDPAAFVKSVRDVSLNAVVEHVINGSSVRVLVSKPDHPGTFYHFTMCLSGIQCPGFKRKDASPAEPTTAPPQLVPMPFALNARYVTETRLLHRDCLLSLEGTDKNGTIFGSLHIPGDDRPNIAEQLVRQGFAKTVSWSIDFNPNAAALRAAERAARDARLAVWAGYVPPPNLGTPSGESFAGRVVEVVSGDVLVVLDLATCEHRRLNLASVRAPRLGRGAAPDAPYAREAREYLRNRLVGRRVNVKIEYERVTTPSAASGEVGGQAASQQSNAQAMKQVYASITRDNGDDVVSGLIGAGLCSVIRHRGEEERAGAYEDYLVKEKEAMEAKKGLHRDRDPPTRRVNDLSGPDARKRAKEMATFYQREGSLRGIVEYVSTGSRFRILLTKDDTLINFALKGARSPAPSRRQPGPGGAFTTTPGEPFGDPAHLFSRENFLQRDVEVDITGVDKIGTFLGSLAVIPPGTSGPSDQIDVTVALLESGFGRIHDFFDPQRDAGGAKFLKAENSAKLAKRGMWANYTEPTQEELAAEEAARLDRLTAVHRTEGTVAEIGSGGRLFIQKQGTGGETLQKVESALGALGLLDDSGEESTAAPEWGAVKVGSTLLAKFRADGKWYRARVLARDNESKVVQVRFIDYGNVDWCPLASLRLLPPGSGLANVEAASQGVRLRGIVVPDDGEEYCVEAGGALRDICYGREVVAVTRGDAVDGMIIGDVTVKDAEVSVNRQLLRLGLARVVRKKDRQSVELTREFEADEAIGKGSRRFLWRYGDAYASDEDEDEETKARWAARRGGP